MFCLVLGSVPLAGAAASETYALILGLCWLAAAGMRSSRCGKARWIPTIVAAASLAIINRTESVAAVLVMTSAFVASVAWLIDATGNRRRFRMIALGSALVVLIHTLRTAAHGIADIEAWIASVLVGFAGTAEFSAMGPTAIGLPVATVFFAFLASRFLLVEFRPIRFGLGVIGGISVVVLALALIHLLPQNWLHHDTLILAPVAVAVGLLALSVALAWRSTATQTLTIEPDAQHPKLFVRVAAATLFLGTVSALLFGSIREPRSDVRVGFCSLNEGRLVDWRVPSFESYGRFSLGFAGLLPKELDAHGFETSLLRERPSDDNLADLDVFVTINIDVDWTVDELQAIWRWVEQGGKLLVLGDHTDLKGSRQSQNDLLTPFGIEFRYDSALASRSVGWTASTTRHPGPLSHQPADRWGLGIGASLELSGNARPVATGGFHLSDIGNELNEANADLGNYAFERGEAIGDLVVIADATFGEGHVLVFGDTSPFQNSANIMRADDVAIPTFRWLSSDAWWDLEGMRPWLEALAGLALLCLLGTARRTPKFVMTVGCAGALCVVWAGSLQASRIAPVRSELPVAWVDLSHGPRLDLSDKAANGIGGLLKNVQRAGFTPRLMEDFDEALLRPGDILFAIAPVTPYSAAEVDSLRDFADDGGLIITTAGHPDQAGLSTLLEPFGLKTGDNLVGPIPLHRNDPERVAMAVEYVEAWELDLSGCPKATTTVWGSYHGIALAALVQHGKGGLFHVGDTRFFSAPNIELRDFVSRPNIGLLRRLFQTTGKGEPQ